MSEIKIHRIFLENFKCHKHLEIKLDGENAKIYGRNACGKSSIYDALTWLLFSKDSRGNGEKNIEIKPLGANGEVLDHMAMTAVEVDLLVDGRVTTLRRTLREVWTNKRGSAEATFDGNASEYFCDGVPMKKYEFQKMVNKIVDEETFRLLTSVSYFAREINWEKRREVLFKLTGVQDDEYILSSDAAFLPLVEAKGALSLGDFKKKLLANKKGLTGLKSDFPARMNELEKTQIDIAGLDFEDARARESLASQQKKEFEAELIALEHDQAADQKRLCIKEAEVELHALENENRAFRAEQGAPIQELRRMELAADSAEDRQKRAQAYAEKKRNQLEDAEKPIEGCRAAWIAKSKEAFEGGMCPTCGQILPADQLAKAQVDFAERKKKQLKEIEEQAEFYKNAKKQLEQSLAEAELEAKRNAQDAVEARTAAERMKSAVHSPEDMPGYAEHRAALEGRIYQLKEELATLQQNREGAAKEIRAKIRAAEADMQAAAAVLAKESLIAYTNERIQALRAEAQNASQKLEQIEKTLFLLDEYSKFKIRFIEDEINGLFRLFRDQANGGLEERCDVTFQGIPYINVNNGMCINLGIDIINTLSRAYGVTVPLFVDNAESVTTLEPCVAQTIELIVSDEEMRVSM